MELKGRKLLILNIIIENYMQTGEPVGSRTISKYSELNISPATIRNEMADLEDMGLIMQPHASAGRVPTDMGYRVYVDNLLEKRLEDLEFREDLLKKKELEYENNSKLLEDKFDRIENLLHNVAVLLADNTNYTTLVTAPSSKMKIKFLQLSMITRNQLILVCVTDGNVIKNQIIDVSTRLSEQTLLQLNVLLNTNLTGKFVEQINLSDIKSIKNKASGYEEIIEKILDALSKMFFLDEDKDIYTGGATNIMKYPELYKADNFEGLLTEIVEKNELTKFMNEAGSYDGAIQIYIGRENKISNMNDCSVVTMNFDINNNIKSTIGIIGPKRMDYEKVIKNLSQLKYIIDKLFDN